MEFSEYIANERVRISNEKRNVESKIKDLQRQIASLDQDLDAVEAYENKKRGARRGRVGVERREAVIQAIRSNPGIQRAGICERMGILGDTNKAQAVSIILTQLVREGVVRREGSRSYYAN